MLVAARTAGLTAAPADAEGAESAEETLKPAGLATAPPETPEPGWLVLTATAAMVMPESRRTTGAGTELVTATVAGAAVALTVLETSLPGLNWPGTAVPGTALTGDGSGSGPTSRVRACVPVRLFASVTSTVNVVLPPSPVPGVPEMIPVDEARLAQPGREPKEMLQVYGVVPPVAWRVAL